VAVAGRNVVVRPGEEVTLRGVESRAPEDATITSYRWSIKKGNPSVKMTVTPRAHARTHARTHARAHTHTHTHTIFIVFFTSPFHLERLHAVPPKCV
jgi:hypothetical protein